MIDGIYKSAMALTVHENRLAASAHNIANITTEGYKSIRSDIYDDKSGSLKNRISKSEEAGPMSVTLSDQAIRISEQSNVSVVEETKNTTLTQRGYEANLKTIKTTDEMLGNAIDIVS